MSDLQVLHAALGTAQRAGPQWPLFSAGRCNNVKSRARARHYARQTSSRIVRSCSGARCRRQGCTRVPLCPLHLPRAKGEWASAERSPLSSAPRPVKMRDSRRDSPGRQKPSTDHRLSGRRDLLAPAPGRRPQAHPSPAPDYRSRGSETGSSLSSAFAQSQHPRPMLIDSPTTNQGR